MNPSPYRASANPQRMCVLCATPLTAQTTVCDECDHPVGAPIDRERLTRERRLCKRNCALGFGGTFAWIALNILWFENFRFALFLVPFYAGIRAALRLRTLNRILGPSHIP